MKKMEFKNQNLDETRSFFTIKIHKGTKAIHAKNQAFMGEGVSPIKIPLIRAIINFKSIVSC